MNIRIENGSPVLLVPIEYLTEHELCVLRYFNQERRDEEFHEARMKALKGDRIETARDPIDEAKLLFTSE